MLGLRDEELAYALWDDIDWDRRLWLVRFKPAGAFSWNSALVWRSKDCEERDIPIPDVLYEELKAWHVIDTCINNAIMNTEVVCPYAQTEGKR